jgi:transcription antitermination factor NusA-like protein
LKAELCQFCLRSGILCSKCKRKVKKGEVTELDLEIARLIVSIEKKYPPLQEIFFHKTIEVDEVIAILVDPGDIARILSYGGKIIKLIEDKTRKRVRILEHLSDERKFLEDLLAPLDIMTINKIWLPDGTTETRVILEGKERRKTGLNIKAIKQIAKKVQGITLRIEFMR